MRTGAALVVLMMLLSGCGSQWTHWLTGRPISEEPPVSRPTSEGAAAAPTDPPAPTGPPVPADPPVPATQPAPAVAAAPMPPAPTPVVLPSPAPAPKPAAAPAPAPMPRPPAMPPRSRAGGAVMAYVNDKPIYMKTLTGLLIDAYGLTVAQQLIANEIVRQEADRQKLDVTDGDVQAEHEKMLQGMFGTVESADQRQRLLSEVLKQRNVSRRQWDLTMWRNALLRKLAAKRITITEAELQEEFGRQHERKLEVRHIQTTNLADAQKVIRELAGGTDFVALVAKYSRGPSAQSAGLLAPFGHKDTGVPPALREAALAMRKVGQVSDPIQVGTAFHVIKLERIIEPKDVKFADVKAQLTESVRQRKIQAYQQDILQILLRGAEVKYVDPALKARAEGGR